MPHPSRIDRRTIVSVAIDLLDELGLDKVSLYAIAARLEVKQPALYHHFASKAALLDAVAEEVLDRHHTDRSPRDDDTWETFVRRNARSLRRAMLSVRDGARLIASAGSRVPELGSAMARVELLQRQGFEGSTAVLALIAVSRYTIGAALEEQASSASGPLSAAVVADDERTGRFVEILRQVTEAGPDAEFELGLGALLRGLDERRSAKAQVVAQKPD